MNIRALRQAIVAVIAAIGLLAPAVPVQAATARIKDIVNIEGVRDNQLVGYGLVVGLNGTGDSLNNSPFTKQSLQAMLERLGVNTRGENMRTGNVAAVMVTANLAAFSTQGSRLDVNVSSLGDATSLQGGTLLVTPLLGADGETYAIAQGEVTINGFKATGDAATIISGVPTTGRISSGGLIEREIALHARRASARSASPSRTPTSPRRAVSPCRSTTSSACPVRPRRITRPSASPCRRDFNGNIVDLVTDVEQFVVETDQPAKIVIDENSGIIVMGKDVRVSTVAVAQSNLTVTVAENTERVAAQRPSPTATPRSCRAPISTSTSSTPIWRWSRNR